MWPADIQHPILKNWLRGTTCHNYWIGRSVLFENDAFIVLKHNSHAAYAGRFSDNGACRAFAALYRKSDLILDATGLNRNLFYGYGHLLRWEGRLSKAKIVAACQEQGITFPSCENAAAACNAETQKQTLGASPAR